jgi:hypothetical protein
MSDQMRTAGIISIPDGAVKHDSTASVRTTQQLDKYYIVGREITANMGVMTNC